MWVHCFEAHLSSWKTVSDSDRLRHTTSSRTGQLTVLFSVVNIPLTSRYAHSEITRDCCLGEGGGGEEIKKEREKCEHNHKRIITHVNRTVTILLNWGS